MPIQAPNLDDLRFQKDLVDEARKRIIHYCPEWTDYNVSDPGITLIELFAWMTEMMVYRFNRVPEINYIKFLEMLGFNQQPASNASTILSFYLSVDLPLSPDDDLTVTIPEGFEVLAEGSEDQIVFSTSQEMKIVHPILKELRKEGDFKKNFKSRMNAEIFRPFDEETPKKDDTFYIGFDPGNSLAGHTLRFDFECKPTEAVGINRKNPPLVWECMTKGGKWVEVHPSTLSGEEDTTGGLNDPTGSLVLYLPLDLEAGELYGINALWVRCRIEQRSQIQGMYKESPQIKSLEVFTIGASLKADHAVNVVDEFLGVSTGEPGQTFELAFSPVLELEEGEHILVEETRNGVDVFLPWKYVPEFSTSTSFDRHFSLDMATGTILFGPAIRQANGSARQYGRVPESGRPIRISRYRYGGGVRGNLPAGSVNTMGMSLAYLARVSNLTRADGGSDQESLEELKLRARRELQAQQRAVTAQDYEQFTLKFPGTARAKCLTPNDAGSNPAGTVSILVVPPASESLRNGDLSKLHLPDEFEKELKKYLDEVRLIATVLNVREPEYYGVQIKAKVVPMEFVNRVDVADQVRHEINRYLTPLALDSGSPLAGVKENWEGWPFGRNMFIGEIMSLIQQNPSVKYVADLEVFSRKVVPLEENTLFDDQPKPVTKVERVLEVPDDGLLCSLEHEIEVIDLEESM